MTDLLEGPSVAEDGRLIIPATINGRPGELRARPWHTLLESLRELGLFGVREGCGVGMCGACTVLLDGEPVSSCLVLSPAVAGREIRTVEGLAGPNGELSDLQQAFVDHTAFQCSYCTSGFLMTAVRLAEEHPDADHDEIRSYLAGNLCRCGSYVKILDAVVDVLERRRAGRSRS
jgi:carbon-monoxide dehydrogenase small subunit/isoquinoline 1-oxidoreductase alpha subunit/xanthine dehydrogenase YagT iron-sulfur-binding subunit